MFGARTVLIGLVLVLLTYAALSAWPALDALVYPQPPPDSEPLLLGSVAPTAATLPRAIPQRVVPGSAVAAQPAPSSRPQPRSIDLSRDRGMSVASWDSEKVRYAVDKVVLRTNPEGKPLQPTSLNRAPLTVLPGTRLLPVKEQGNWVLVSSPSSMLGWVRKSELANTRPPEQEKRWK